MLVEIRGQFSLYTRGFMSEIRSQRNYMTKRTKRGKMTNIPTGQTGFQSGGTLGQKGQVWQNDLLNTDYTRQDMGTVRKLKD